MEINFDLKGHLAIDTSIKTQMLRVTNNLNNIKSTRKHIQDTCFAFPFAEIYIILSINTDSTCNLVKSGGDEYEFSYSTMDGEQVASNLFKLDSKASGEQQSLDHVPSISGIYGLKAGDSVQVGFYDSSRQKPYIRGIVKRGSITTHGGVVPPAPSSSNDNWPQALGNIQKTGQGFSTLNYASGIRIPFEEATDGWHNLYDTATTKRRLNNDDHLWPTLLIARESHAPPEGSEDPPQKISTLVHISHDVEITGISSYFHLYGLSAPNNTDPTYRQEITSLTNLNGGLTTSFPIKIFDGRPTAFNSLGMLPMSSGYLRSFDRNGETNCTIFEPVTLNPDGVTADGAAGDVIDIYETHEFSEGQLVSIDLPHDVVGETITVNLDGDTFHSAYSLGSDASEVAVFTLTANHTVQFTMPTLDPIENILITIEYLYHVAAESSSFMVHESILNRLNPDYNDLISHLPPSRVNAYFDLDTSDFVWPGFMGASHISVANSIMIQVHPAAEMISIYSLDITDNLTWTWRRRHVWEDIITQIASEGHNNSWEFCKMSLKTNFSPAKLKDIQVLTEEQAATEETLDGFVFPGFSIKQSAYDRFSNPDNTGGTFESYLWLVRIRFNRFTEVFDTSVIQLLRRVTPTSADITALTSAITETATTVKANMEDRYSITFGSSTSTDRYYVYACLEPVAGGEFLVGCSDPCWIIECNSAAASGCTTYSSVSHYLLLGTNTFQYVWLGAITEQITDSAGHHYPSVLPEYDGLKNVIIPLPAGSPNLNGPDISRCCWSSLSKNNYGGGIMSIDPQTIVDKDTGLTYFCFTEGKFFRTPTGGGTLINQRPSIDNQEGLPNPGQELCPEVWDVGYFGVIQDCARCAQGPFGPEGDIGVGGYSGPFPYLRAGAVTLPSDQIIGDTLDIFSGFTMTQVMEARETKLAIIDRSGSALIIPISKTFSGVKFTNGTITNFSLAEELPLPENVYQLGFAKGVLILLRDDREEFTASPRPILEIRNPTTGDIITSYKGLIPDALYADVFTEYTGGWFTGETKWRMHGKYDEGPKMKISWDQTEASPAYIHLSTDMIEKSLGGPTFKTRVEYRIISLTGTALTEVKTGSDERDVDTGHTPWFGDTYPRAGNLMSMAISETETIIPFIPNGDDNPSETWTLFTSKGA